MQDFYDDDIGDFGKFALLLELQEQEPSRCAEGIRPVYFVDLCKNI